jgi:hypothetical protein
MYDVLVNIDLTKPIGKLGFGVPLLLQENATKAVEYTECANVSEVVAAGFDATTTVYKAATLLFAQNNAPKKIAVYATTDSVADALADTILTGRGWRQLIVVGGNGSSESVPAIATAIEALPGKMYFASLDTDDSTQITTSNLWHTVLFYCDATEDVPVPVAALVGEVAGRAAGSFTYKNLKLTGIAAQDLTDAEVEAIHKKGGMTYVAKAGDNVTSDGKVAGGEFVDVIDSEDYIVQQLAYKTQKLLNNVDKVPYDNNGIAMLEGVAMDVLRGAYNDGMIASKEDGSPDYSVSYAMREDTADTDRAARKYLGGNFTFALAGAIHYVEIAGTITA